jgi:hypothetical protein
MNASETWAAHPVGITPGSYGRPSVELTGPGVNDLVRWVAEMLADSIHDGDTRADAWSDYVIAVGNLKAADDDTRPGREADAADAWWALEAELPNALRMSLVDACAVRQLLDRTARNAVRQGVKERTA